MCSKDISFVSVGIGFFGLLCLFWAWFPTCSYWSKTRFPRRFLFSRWFAMLKSWLLNILDFHGPFPWILVLAILEGAWSSCIVFVSNFFQYFLLFHHQFQFRYVCGSCHLSWCWPFHRSSARSYGWKLTGFTLFVHTYPL